MGNNEPDPMELTGIFNFDPDDRIYGDHFPGNPVVPGSIIVHAFLTAGKAAGFLKENCIIRDFRFRGFVAPGEHAFHIRWVKDHMACRLYQSVTGPSKTLVTGTITA